MLLWKTYTSSPEKIFVKTMGNFCIIFMKSMYESVLCCAVTDCKGRFFPLDMGVKGHTDLSRLILMTQNHQHMHIFQRCWGKEIKEQTWTTAGQGRQKKAEKQHNWKYRIKLSAHCEKHIAPRCRATGEIPDAWDRRAGDTAVSDIRAQALHLHSSLRTLK